MKVHVPWVFVPSLFQHEPESRELYLWVKRKQYLIVKAVCILCYIVNNQRKVMGQYVQGISLLYPHLTALSARCV